MTINFKVGGEMKKGVLLVNLGTPEAPTTAAVRTYLRKFLADKRVIDMPRALWLPILYGMILPVRPAKSAALYRKIWTSEGSPLLLFAQQQAKQLQVLLPEQIVQYAMCYSDPTVDTALESMAAAGVTELTVIPLYPQYSTTRIGSVFDQVAAHYMHSMAQPKLHLVDSFYEDEKYIQILVDQIKQELVNQPDAHLVFSYHGIPQKYADHGDPYPNQCTTTTKRVMDLIGDVPYTQSYQSKFGPSQWLLPATAQTMRELPSQNVTNIIVITPGFVADCLETIQEIDHENREYFMESGGKEFTYIHPFNGNEKFTNLLASLAK